MYVKDRGCDGVGLHLTSYDQLGGGITWHGHETSNSTKRG